MHYRVCLDCGEEFRPDIAVCSDCGGRLEDRNDDGSAPPTSRPSTPSDAQAPHESLVEVLVARNARDLVPAAERLKDEGVEFWLRQAVVDREGALTRFVLAVRTDDHRRAGEFLRRLVDEGLAADFFPAVDSEGEGGGGPTYSTCPACGNTLGAGTLECPECGLILGEPARDASACPACGEPTAAGGGGCASCGLGRA